MSAPPGASAASYPRSQVALGVFIASASIVLMGVQSILVGLFADHLHLDLNQNGWVLAAEQYGAAAGALLGYAIAARLPWSYSVAGGCALAAIVNFLSPYAGGIAELGTLRLLSGFFTTAVYTVGVYFLSQTANPDRVFGVLMVLTTSFFSVDAMLLPFLGEQFGYVIAVQSGGLWFVAAMIAAFWLPRGRRAVTPAPAASGGQSGRRPLVGLAALLGAFFLQLSIFAIWGFLERIGRNNGLSDEQIGYGIGVGVLGGIPAALLPALVGDRFGRVSMIAVATVLLVASYVAFDHPLGMLGYLCWITILNVGWVLGLVYYMGLTVAHDADGRLSRLMTFSQFLAAGVGPTCSALVIARDDLSPIFVVASVSALAGLLAVLLAVRIRPGAAAFAPAAKSEVPH